MKLVIALSVIALILCITSKADAAVSLEEADCEPRKMWTEPGCLRKECLSDGKHIETATCGVIGCPPGVNIKPGDESKPYPDCCPTC